MTYPVLAIKGPSIELKRTAEELHTCTMRALRPGGWFDRPFPALFDARGVEHAVRSVGHPTKIGKKAFPGLFAPSLVRVDLDIEEIGPVAVERFKEAVLRAIEEAPHVWANATGDLLPSTIDAAKSFEDVWQVIVAAATAPSSQGE